ncbi:MAG TPA: hypothetical protein PK392_03695 [Opitutaceae bacterium]|nr:hypothetical protein [Opitutaceae bacterium]HQL21151.1 hypothetical protein [Opitutaceae bacterium]
MAKLHFDARGAGIERVFHQLLHDRGGALHHLASGDLVGDPVGKDADFGHGLGNARRARRSGLRGNAISP